MATGLIAAAAAASAAPPGSPERKAAREAIAERKGRLRRLGESVQDRALEWLSGLVMIGWGLTLAGPGQTLSLPSYAAFHWIPWMTETMWAWAFGTLGAVRWTALYVNGRWPQGPWIRIVCAGIGTVSWATIAVMVTSSNLVAYHVAGTGLAVYGALAIGELLSIYRAAFDVRYRPGRS